MCIGSTMKINEARIMDCIKGFVCHFNKLRHFPGGSGIIELGQFSSKEMV